MKKVLYNIHHIQSIQMARAYGNSEVVTAVPLSTQVTCLMGDIAIFTELTFVETSRISLQVSSANLAHYMPPINWLQSQIYSKRGFPQETLLYKLFEMLLARRSLMKTDGKMKDSQKERNFFLALLECHSVFRKDLRTLNKKKKSFLIVGK